MFDTHCHLNFSQFEDSLPNVIHRADSAGVKGLVVPGVDLESSKKAVDIAKDYGQCWAACGLHPTIGDLEEEDFSKVLLNLEELAQSSDKVVAIGEVGLDYYKYRLPSRLQKKLLKEQVRIAAKLGLSLILHNRHASEDFLSIIKENWQDAFEGAIVFHCCEPNSDILKFAIDRGLYIGIDGDVTYDKSKADFVKNVPIANLVLETDSPFLTPEPIRSTKVFPNEPVNLLHILNFVSNVKGIVEEELKNITFSNSLKLFVLGLTEVVFLGFGFLF